MEDLFGTTEDLFEPMEELEAALRPPPINEHKIDKSARLARVLSLITQRPELVQYEYTIYIGKLKVNGPPLYHLLHDDADFDLIVKTYNLCPEFMADHSTAYQCFRCAFKFASPKTVLFILEKNTSVLERGANTATSSDWLLIREVLGLEGFVANGVPVPRLWRSASELLELQKSIMELCPSFHRQGYQDSCRTNDRYLPLTQLFVSNTQEKLLEYMVNRFPKDVKRLRLQQMNFGYSIDGSKAYLLQKLMPQLEDLMLEPSQVTQDALPGILDSLSWSPHLQRLDLRIPRKCVADNPIALRAFENVTSSSIEDIKISLHKSPNTHSDSSILLAFVKSIKNMTCLKEMTLDGFQLEDGNACLSLLAAAPQKLSLQSFSIHDGKATTFSSPQPDFGSCRLAKVMILKTKITQSFWDGLCTGLAKSPAIRTLGLFNLDWQEQAQGNFDITCGLNQLFQSPCLRTLMSHKMKSSVVVDATGITKTLKKNKTLQYLRCPDLWNEKDLPILEEILECNTTLKDISMSMGEQADNIRYLEKLNKLGRQKARDYSTKASEMVDLLLRVSEADSPDITSPVEVFNLQFGLLREMSIHLWNLDENSQVKKRKQCTNISRTSASSKNRKYA